jgi:Protein of unknown function (DUF2778)
MWSYYQTNGLLISADGKTTLHCYAGFDEGKNNPAKQDIQNVGPLPCGIYTAQPPFDDPHHGPFSMRLVPHPSNVMFGRSAFMYHADAIDHPGKASNGCIVSIGTPLISGRKERETFWNSYDHVIEVKSGLVDIADIKET